MNIILSKNAAKKLQKEADISQDFMLDKNTWRIDCLSLRKRSIFIITHEETLYTLISSYKQGVSGIIDKLAATTKQEKINTNNIHYIKSQNRSLVSSMNNIKTIINNLDKYSTINNEKFEELINHTPFKYLSYQTPAECYLTSKLAH
jgi:IS30 family transposase